MDLIFHAQFVASKVGKTGLSGTNMVQVYRTTRSDGTTSQVVTNGTGVETAKGVYRYRLASADLTLYDYVGVFVTADATVDQQEVPAAWSQYAGESQLAAVERSAVRSGLALAGWRQRYFDRTRGPLANYTLSMAELLDLVDQNVARGGVVYRVRAGDVLATAVAGKGQYSVFLLEAGTYACALLVLPADAVVACVSGTCTLANLVSAPISVAARGVFYNLAFVSSESSPGGDQTYYSCTFTGDANGINSANSNWSAWNCTMTGETAGIRNTGGTAAAIELHGCSATATPSSDHEVSGILASTGLVRMYGGSVNATQFGAVPTANAYGANGVVELYGVGTNAPSGNYGVTVYASVNSDPLRLLLGQVDGTAIESRVTTARAVKLDTVSTYAGGDTAGTTMLLGRVTAAVATAAQGVAILEDTGLVKSTLAAVLDKWLGITRLGNWLRALARKDVPDATAIAEINSGGGMYAPASDSQEAIRDRGDAAWITADLTAVLAAAGAAQAAAQAAATDAAAIKIVTTKLGGMLADNAGWQYSAFALALSPAGTGGVPLNVQVEITELRS